MTLFTFHLLMVGPDNVCAKHVHSSHGSVATADMTMEHGSPDAGMPHGESRVPCDTPSSAHCCDAFASCTVTVALDARDSTIAVPMLASIVPASTDAALLSRALAPEPPPPKL